MTKGKPLDPTLLDDCPTLSLNDLPAYSPWPPRLLGAASWSVPNRDQHKVEVEYNQEKYRRCLQYYQESHGRRTIEEIKYFELGLASNSPEVCISDADKLRKVPRQRAIAAHFAHLVRRIAGAAQGHQSVVSLGCGYGYILHKLAQVLPGDVPLIGGEFAASAIELATLLFAGQSRVKIRAFDFYKASDYDFLADLPAPVFVYTSHAVEQLPSAQPFVDNLRPHAARIGAVLCCEPIADQGGDLLGLLRQRYIAANDYNRDLVELLRSTSDIEYEVLDCNVFGLNPLNPTTFVRWNFL